MTGLEVIAIAALAGGGSTGLMGLNKKQTRLNEERTACELYQRFFLADLFESSSDVATVVGQTLPIGLDTNAAACIRLIEKYQKDRGKAGFFDFSGRTASDMRTRILEEMKDWLLTVSVDGGAQAEAINTRLEYCRQILMRPKIFEASNSYSFVNTIAQVCRQLERLLRHAISNQRNGAEKMEQVLNLGRQTVEAMLPVLLFSVTDAANTMCRRTGWKGAPEPIDTAALRLAAKGFGSTIDVNWSLDVYRLLKILLCTKHVSALFNGEKDEEAEDMNEDETQEAVAEAMRVGNAAGAASVPAAFSEVIQEVRTSWLEIDVGSRSGLLHAFRGERFRQVRNSYLDLLVHMDHVAYFLSVLQRYHRLASIVGDVALCQLYPSLSHLLQELESALVQHRQARNEVMRAAKKRLRDLAKEMGSTSATDVRWMQGLGFVSDMYLDDMHRAVVTACTEVRAASSATRAFELQIQARQGLGDIMAAFSSVDFESRCSLALPDGMMSEMKRMAIAAGPAGPECQGLAALDDSQRRSSLPSPDGPPRPLRCVVSAPE